MIVKIISVALAAVFLSLAIKKHCGEFSAAAVIAAGAAILLMVLPELMKITSQLYSIAQDSRIPSQYIKLLLKVIGIGYICEFSAAAATDAGEKGISEKIQLAGKISIMLLSMPLFVRLIEMITGILP